MRTFDVDASITRGSNTYGPNQYPEKFIPLFVTNALDGEPLPLYGDGRQVRDWLYVEDHCAGIELVLREGGPGEIYNVGGGDEHENIEVAQRLIELAGADRVAPAPRRGPAGPRPPLLARHDEAPRPRLAARRPGSRTASGRRSTGTARTAPGGSRSSPASYREYYERQYGQRLAESGSV